MMTVDGMCFQNQGDPKTYRTKAASNVSQNQAISNQKSYPSEDDFQAMKLSSKNYLARQKEQEQMN